jgi:hypothetical protein
LAVKIDCAADSGASPAANDEDLCLAFPALPVAKDECLAQRCQQNGAANQSSGRVTPIRQPQHDAA